jgi:hypothetical protein
MGRAGSQSKSQRENSKNLSENFRDALRYIVSRIVKDEDLQSEHALGRSMACFAVGMQTSNTAGVSGGSKEVPVSFGYVAASVCLWELEKWKKVSYDALTFHDELFIADT